MQESQTVLLVDESDRPSGSMGKIEAHERGLLHRAFSVFVLRHSDGRAQVLLQKRARSKYHFGGLWTNACCGHPLEGETPAQAGERRLPQEMNFSCSLRAIGSFIYRAQSANGLIEHELDHVLVGFFEDETLPEPDPAEADGASWIDAEALDRELASKPDEFTPWFGKAYAIVKTSPEWEQAKTPRPSA